jgi:protein-S-isoprenylcysteine O-methyltransferase Ste14
MRLLINHAKVKLFIIRLLDEEKFLEKNLIGYIGYKNNVKYRLVPFAW